MLRPNVGRSAASELFTIEAEVFATVAPNFVSSSRDRPNDAEDCEERPLSNTARNSIFFRLHKECSQIHIPGRAAEATIHSTMPQRSPSSLSAFKKTIRPHSKMMILIKWVNKFQSNRPSSSDVFHFRGKLAIL